MRFVVEQNDGEPVLDVVVGNGKDMRCGYDALMHFLQCFVEGCTLYVSVLCL